MKGLRGEEQGEDREGRGGGEGEGGGQAGRRMSRGGTAAGVTPNEGAEAGGGVDRGGEGGRVEGWTGRVGARTGRRTGRQQDWQRARHRIKRAAACMSINTPGLGQGYVSKHRLTPPTHPPHTQSPPPCPAHPPHPPLNVRTEGWRAPPPHLSRGMPTPPPNTHSPVQGHIRWGRPRIDAHTQHPDALSRKQRHSSTCQARHIPLSDQQTHSGSSGTAARVRPGTSLCC